MKKLTKNINIYQIWEQIGIGINYSYDKQDQKPHMINIHLIVWQIEINWK